MAIVIGRGGRFRPWIARMAIPVAVSSALLYAPFIADWTYPAKLGYAVTTYLLWGSICYTTTNISYGSMASVISDTPEHRSSLSAFRGLGANGAGLIVSLVPPLFIYATIDGTSQVVPSHFFGTALAFSALAAVFYFLCFTGVQERIEGLVQCSYEQSGLSTPGSTKSQVSEGGGVSEDEARPGDVVFHYSSASHNGIYIGNGKVVHASTEGQDVNVEGVKAIGDINTLRRFTGW